MHGNRDFLIVKKFAIDTGITLLADPAIVTIYERKMLLAKPEKNPSSNFMLTLVVKLSMSEKPHQAGFDRQIIP